MIYAAGGKLPAAPGAPQEARTPDSGECRGL